MVKNSDVKLFTLLKFGHKNDTKCFFGNIYVLAVIIDNSCSFSY